jgi:protein gp37
MSTKIEWTSETWNFLRGCSRDNEECDRCYAMVQVHRHLQGELDDGLTKLRPKGAPRPGVDWTGVVKVIEPRLALPLSWQKARKVFVNSMSDLFHPAVPFEVIAAAFGIMAATPRHTYQVLTKRPDVAAKFFAWAEEAGAKYDLLTDGMPPALLACAWEACTLNVERINEDTEFTTPTTRVFGHAWPLPNVQLGVSAGRPGTANEKVPALLKLPAAVRWVSAEPLLDETDFTKLALADGLMLNALNGAITKPSHRGIVMGPKLDWIVVGGESGTKARRCDIEWIRSIIAQCQKAGTPVFVKQLGSAPVFYPGNEATGYEGIPQILELDHNKGGEINEWPEDLRVRQWPA